MKPKTYLSTGSAALRLGISRSTLRNWIADGRIKAVRLPYSKTGWPGQWRIAESEIGRLLATGQERRDG